MLFYCGKLRRLATGPGFTIQESMQGAALEDDDGIHSEERTRGMMDSAFSLVPTCSQHWKFAKKICAYSIAKSAPTAAWFCTKLNRAKYFFPSL